AFLDVHCHQVSIEHRRRLHQHLAQRDRGEFEREAAGLQYAALDGFGQAAEMKVAVDELRPAVGDADDWPVTERPLANALGLQVCAMRQAGLAGGLKPSGTSKARSIALTHAASLLQPQAGRTLWRWRLASQLVPMRKLRGCERR